MDFELTIEEKNLILNSLNFYREYYIRDMIEYFEKNPELPLADESKKFLIKEFDKCNNLSSKIFGIK